MRLHVKFSKKHIFFNFSRGQWITKNAVFIFMNTAFITHRRHVFFINTAFFFANGICFEKNA